MNLPPPMSAYIAAGFTSNVVYPERKAPFSKWGCLRRAACVRSSTSIDSG